MPQHPEYVYERLASYPPVPFTYDASVKMFTIGDEQVPLAAYEQWNQPAVEPVSSKQMARIAESNGLLLGVLDQHIQTPKMYDWIRSRSPASWKSAQDSITEAMIDAHAALSDDSKKRLLKGTHWGFGVELYRAGHPVFNVLGNCACYGVDPHSIIMGEEYWETGFAGYGEHNIDWIAQRVVLHAGAGALAAMVE